MKPEKEKCIELNKEEYKEIYPLMKFPDKKESLEMENQRKAIIRSLQTFEDIHLDYNESKLFSRRLSPGCRCCGEGTWSCLFINNLCNGQCFFCPTTQNQLDEPATSTLRFQNPRDYIDYIRRFQFKGVSISGGEPLLTFDRTLTFLTEVKKHFGDAVYLWLYTNGILLDIEKIIRLKYAGLNEIRLNLCAVDYRLEKIKLAAGQIPRITVEIPAIPEDIPKIKELMIQLADLGVDILNLHQLRCTPNNARHLIKRGYTFIHGKKVTVWESELKALELIRYGLEEQLPLAVNYCSYAYKNRYQALTPRLRYARMMCREHEDITSSGYIRKLSVKISSARIDHISEQLNRNHHPKNTYRLDKTKNRIYFNQTLLNPILALGNPLMISYDQAFIRSYPSYRNPYLEIPLNTGRKVVIERQPVFSDQEVSRSELEKLKNHWQPHRENGKTQAESPLGKEMEFYEFESLRSGLNDYY